MMTVTRRFGSRHVPSLPPGTTRRAPSSRRHGGAESSESHVRSSSCRPGQILRGRPTSVVGRKPSYPSRIRVERVAPPAEVLWPARCRITASGLRGRPVRRVTVAGLVTAMSAGAAAVTALLGRLAECARFSPAWAMLVAPVVSTLGAHWPLVAPAVSVSACRRGSPAVSHGAGRQYHAARRMWQWPGTCSWCRWYPSQDGPSRRFSKSIASA